MDNAVNTAIAPEFQTGDIAHPQIIPDHQVIHIRTSVRAIAEDVARRRGRVTAAEIFGRSGERRVSHARQEVMWWARQAGLSFTMIARRFPNPATASGHMDHSTVQWGVKRHEKRRRASAIARIQADNAASARAHGGL